MDNWWEPRRLTEYAYLLIYSAFGKPVPNQLLWGLSTKRMKEENSQQLCLTASLQQVMRDINYDTTTLWSVMLFCLRENNCIIQIKRDLVGRPGRHCTNLIPSVSSYRKTLPLLPLVWFWSSHPTAIIGCIRLQHNMYEHHKHDNSRLLLFQHHGW